MSSYYTVDQVANLIDLHPKTVRRYIQAGRLNANKVGAQYRISQNELDNFIGAASGTGEPPTEKIAKPGTNSMHLRAEVNTQVDIAGVDDATATFLTQRVLSVLCKLTDVRADCIYYDSQHKLKVLLFGTIETTDQMLKHINILISQANSQ